MTLLGVGSALIDLILPKDTYKPGEHINGYFLIKGGIIEQQLKRVDCDLIMLDSENDTEVVIDSTTILTSKQIESEESNKLLFTFKLPHTIPPSTDAISYYFKTKLTFNKGVESRDLDKIKIIKGE